MTHERWLPAAAALACLIGHVGAAAAQSESDLAKASQNPVANLNSFPLQYNYSSGGGLQSRTYLLLNVQPVMPLPLDDKWLLVSRTIVPYTSIPLPDGTRRTGVADIQQQTYFTPKKPGMLVWGAGPIFSIPSATNDAARTGQWALGPTAVALVSPGRWVIGALANNLWRVSGVDNGPPVNQLTVQPFVNFNIPSGWAIVTAPIIMSNWSSPEGERWTVPIGIGLSKVTAIGRQPVSLGMQYYHNVKHPTPAGADQFRFQFTLLYPVR
ncbi:MAG TPA: hypothetical protein VH277_07625 [Gemmatimonadaceae bacterium]|jgi:hypothetical protein|nr:hypothetical protein [Gemmatimonadaceae bacterium]